MEFKIALIVILSVGAMWLIKKLVESVINILILYKASKDPNHPARISNSGIVYNKKTHKLEGSSDKNYKIILPFN